MRSQRLDLLERMLETAELDPDNRNKLQLELVGLLDNIARETELENLLKMNGYLMRLFLSKMIQPLLLFP